MSSNNNKDKKTKPLSASSLCKTVSKYTARSQLMKADEATSSRQTHEPDTLTLSEQNIMINNVLSEDYSSN